MQKPFDIAADLHTPVSAYLRLAPLRPRYLLESVEEGYQGRYSFIGFGDALRVEVETDGIYADGEFVSEDLLVGLRRALELAPGCGPAIKDQPFSAAWLGLRDSIWSAGCIRCRLRLTSQRSPRVATWQPSRFWYSII